MQPVEKKRRRQLRHGRLWLLLGAILLLGGSTGAYLLLSRPEETYVVEESSSADTLYAYDIADVASLQITLRGGESWQLTQAEDGTITVDGDSSFQVAERKRESLLTAAATVSWEDVLTEDASAYAENFADFGLEVPRVIAEIDYRDGTSVTLRIGDNYALEESGWCYMTIDGDARLFALDAGTADNLAVEKARLHPVEQPTLHQVRFDRITLTGADGEIKAQWTLQGGIGGDADDRWLLTAPLTYPADGESIANLHDNLENLRLGAYVAEATPENLTLYGFDMPQFAIEIHMAEGSIGATNEEGVYEVTDWPESTFMLTVGGKKNDSVDYVCMGDSIYLTSHYSLQTFMNMNPADTLTRYTVPTALGNLASLTIETAAGSDTYVLMRTEQVAENNDLVYDDEGNVVYDVTCTRNGVEIPYSSFEVAYNDLLVVTVSGSLPEKWSPQETAHTTYTFVQVDGVTHTVSLIPYDAFHDAVALDGNTLFYLIKNGMTFTIEQ